MDALGVADDELVEIFLLCYVQWRESCLDVARSSAAWSDAAAWQRHSKFAAHLLAIAREEEAAADYATMTAELLQSAFLAPGS